MLAIALKILEILPMLICAGGSIWSFINATLSYKHRNENIYASKTFVTCICSAIGFAITALILAYSLFS